MPECGSSRHRSLASVPRQFRSKANIKRTKQVRPKPRRQTSQKDTTDMMQVTPDTDETPLMRHRCANNTPSMRQRYAVNTPLIRHGYASDVTIMSPLIPLICHRYAVDTPLIRHRCATDSPLICFFYATETSLTRR